MNRNKGKKLQSPHYIHRFIKYDRKEKKGIQKLHISYPSQYCIYQDICQETKYKAKMNI